MGSNAILPSIKKLLGIPEDYEDFDQELMFHINAAMSVLTQLGVGPVKGFKVTSKRDMWASLLISRVDLETVKMIVYLRVRLSFDPPQNSFLVESLKKQCDELEWRVEVQCRENI